MTRTDLAIIATVVALVVILALVGWADMPWMLKGE